MTRAYVYSSPTTPIRCPSCLRVLDAATGVSTNPGDPLPEATPGDVTVCAYCGTILTFTVAGFRLATMADLAALDPQLRTLVLAFSATRAGTVRH